MKKRFPHDRITKSARAWVYRARRATRLAKVPRIASTHLTAAHALCDQQPSHVDQRIMALHHAAQLQAAEAQPGTEYHRIRAHFDTLFYLSKYKDVALFKADPIAHYIRFGKHEKRDPSPLFSNTQYLARYPEAEAHNGSPLDHWITVGQTKGYSGHPAFHPGMTDVLNMSSSAIEARLRQRTESARQRLCHGALGDMVAKAAAIDPSVTESWPAAMNVKFLPFSSARITRRVSELRALQDALEWQRAKVLVVADDRALHAPEFARVLGVLNTASAMTDAAILWTGEHSFPESVAPSDCLRIAHLRPDRQRHPFDANRLPVDLIFGLQPGMIINFDAELFAKTLKFYGRALRSVVPIDTIVPSGGCSDLKEAAANRIVVDPSVVRWSSRLISVGYKMEIPETSARQADAQGKVPETIDLDTYLAKTLPSEWARVQRQPWWT